MMEQENTPNNIHGKSSQAVAGSSKSQTLPVLRKHPKKSLSTSAKKSINTDNAKGVEKITLPRISKAAPPKKSKKSSTSSTTLGKVPKSQQPATKKK